MTAQHIQLRHDRWADWAVVGLLIVALLLGWAVMAAAQGQRVTYTDVETGISVRYPEGWLVQDAEDAAFRVVDASAERWPTTYAVRSLPVDPAAPATSTLSMILNNVSLTRAQQNTAYRLFTVEEGQEIDGQPSMEASYVFVAESDDLYVQRMPAVMLGRDVAILQGSQALVFSLEAPEGSFDQAEEAFRRFIASAETVSPGESQ